MLNGTRFLFMLIALLLVCATGAVGDTVTAQLTTGNSAISGFSDPYADITVTIVGGVADFTITTDSNATNQYYLGDGGTFGFVSTVTGTIGSVVEDGSFKDSTGSGNEDGFGSFNNQIDNNDGTGGALSSLTFTFTGSAAFTSVSDFLGTNSLGNSFAGHVFVCAAGQTQTECAAGTGALATGFATNGTPTTAPEPNSLLLLSAGVLALVGLRKMSAAAA